MSRERVLSFVLIVAGLLCSAALYPLVAFWQHWQGSNDIVPMFLSLYATLGLLLLLAARNSSSIAA